MSMFTGMNNWGDHQRVDSPCENEFIRKMKEEWSISVKETEYWIGIQGGIRMWIDTSVAVEKNSFLERLYTAIRENGIGWALDVEEGFSEEIRIFAKKVSSLYWECFSLPNPSSGEICLYAYDFLQACRSKAIGRGIRGMAERLYAEYGIPMENVICLHEPAVSVVCRQEKEEQRLISLRPEIEQICFEEALKHDPYRLIKEEDIPVRILNLSKIDKGKANDISMEQSLGGWGKITEGDRA